MPIKVAIYTALALLAFAGNSVLCRLALADGLIDPASFTTIRLISGMFFLGGIYQISQWRFSISNNKNHPQKRGSWKSALLLFIYAAGFSYAYISLDTGMGALILFAAVQLTMITYTLFNGASLNIKEWIGITLAFFGFVYLVLPGAQAPSLEGIGLMLISGVAWALYTLAGKQSTHPLADTTFNFIRCTPLVALLTLATFHNTELSFKGFYLAVLSGALASGAGYAIWYMALRSLSGIQAGVLQLLVPVLAATGGVVFAYESLSLRLIIASAVILGGVLVVLLAGNKRK